MVYQKNFVSIIIPAFNASATIIETLISVQIQTYENWECIIINDGSKDDTSAVVSSFIRDNPRFKLMNILNVGVSKARNIGISNSVGQFILPLDSDNWIDSDFLEKVVFEFNKNAELKLVYTEAMLFGLENRLWNLPQYSFSKILQYNMIDNTSMYYREDFDRVGGYRENMTMGLEDWDFWIALLAEYKDDQVYKINEPLFHYRVSKISRNSQLIQFQQFDKMLQLLVFNNFAIYQSHFINIHQRIISYDYQSDMLQKWPLRTVLFFMNKFKKIKLLLFK